MNKLFSLIFLLSSFTILAQDDDPYPVVDGVIAVVGDEIILRSEIEKELDGLGISGDDKTPEARCEVVYQSIQQKLMITKAKQDSVEVTPEQVQAELDQRMAYFVNQLGSERALEKYYDKSIPRIKDELRPLIKEQLTARKVRDQIVGEINVSPEEVRKYYRQIPEDSLPYYNTEVEVGKLVLFPKPTKESKSLAREKLEELRVRVMKGTSFDNLAILYSEDNASATKGGDLGMRNKDDYVPRFSAAAMKLSKDSVSGVVESQFGFHLIKMVERRGDNIHVKHILIKPEVDYKARNKTLEKIDSIRNEIIYDTLTFPEAAQMHSQDEQTKNNGGMIIDPQTNSTRIPVEQLEANTFFVIDTMSEGDISEPIPYNSPDGRKGFQLLYLKDKIAPHVANVKDDYAKLKRLALNDKKVTVLDEWYEQYRSDTYLSIIDEYSECKQLSFYFDGKKTANNDRK